MRHLEMVYLCEKGANINEKDKYGKTALDYAPNNSRIAKYLKEKEQIDVMIFISKYIIPQTFIITPIVITILIEIYTSSFPTDTPQSKEPKLAIIAPSSHSLHPHKANARKNKNGDFRPLNKDSTLLAKQENSPYTPKNGEKKISRVGPFHLHQAPVKTVSLFSLPLLALISLVGGLGIAYYLLHKSNSTLATIEKLFPPKEKVSTEDRAPILPKREKNDLKKKERSTFHMTRSETLSAFSIIISVAILIATRHYYQEKKRQREKRKRMAPLTE